MISVMVEICPNPDYGQSFPKKRHIITSDVAHIYDAVLAFQQRYDIGGGNWGKAVVTDGEKIIGYMSYNGKIWNLPTWGSDWARATIVELVSKACAC